MKILALETSTKVCSLALTLGEETQSYSLEAPQQHTQLLLPEIQKLLQQTGCELNQLDTIVFGCGPGSFTGLRIAAGLVQGMAYGADLPVIAISSLRCLAQTAYRHTQAELICCGVDARMQGIYVGVYQLNQQGLMVARAEDYFVKAEQTNLTACQQALAVGDAWQVYANLISERLLREFSAIETQLYPDAVDLLNLAKIEFAAGNTVKAKDALPIYMHQVYSNS